MAEMADRVEKDPEIAGKGPEKWVEDAPDTNEAPRMKSKLEKRLLLKMDLSIVPLLALTFFIAYMVFPKYIPSNAIRTHNT
jgi:hypothetical protein